MLVNKTKHCVCGRPNVFCKKTLKGQRNIHACICVGACVYMYYICACMYIDTHMYIVCVFNTCIYIKKGKDKRPKSHFTKDDIKQSAITEEKVLRNITL